MELLIFDWFLGDLLGIFVWFWLVFVGLVLVFIVFDFGVFNCENKEMGIGELLKFFVFYIVIVFVFGVWVWVEKGGEVGM